MKAVFIAYNQAFTERVEYILDQIGIRGYSMWTDTYGRGSTNGDPHMGTHTWPEINNSILSIIDDEKVDILLDDIKKLNQVNEEVGIRAFVWNVERSV